MTYQETLDYMFAQLPMYHRIGAAAYKADIQPTVDMMNALGNPERKFRTIHIAGTNGKGSVSHFLASILQESGYRTGLYTSPHLIDFRERIRINGEMISQDAVVDFVQQHNDMLKEHKLSFFEMTVGMAFDYFARQEVDIAVIEVGMGGRLDSTNVISPLLSIITNIGLDHTQFLGDTLKKIAVEKAGIIKENTPVVIGETHHCTESIFRDIANSRHAPISFADKHHTVDCIEDYTHQLTGDYQRKNIATVLEAIDKLREYTPLHITSQAVSRGLANVVTNTHLNGRWQKIDTHPTTICETAHNAPGIESMLRSVKQALGKEHLHIIYGCVNDKDFSSILEYLRNQLPADTQWYFTQPSVPRRKAVEELAAAANEMGFKSTSYPDPLQAIAAARSVANDEDLVLVTGSIFLVADVLAGYSSPTLHPSA